VGKCFFHQIPNLMDLLLKDMQTNM